MDLRLLNEEVEFRTADDELRLASDDLIQPGSAEKKQWDSYSPTEKRRLLKRAQRYHELKTLSQEQYLMKEANPEHQKNKFFRRRTAKYENEEIPHSSSGISEPDLPEALMRRDHADTHKKQKQYKNSAPAKKYKDHRMRFLMEQIRSDIQKNEFVDEAQKEQLLEDGQAQRYGEMGILRSVSAPVRIPLKIRLEQAMLQITKMVSKAVFSAVRYLAAFLFPLLVFLLILAALAAGIMVSENSEDTSTVVGSGSGNSIVEYAREYIGVTKYVWGAGRGGNEDWKDYTDCSGFVSGVFSHFDYQIGSSTIEMEKLAGTVIARNDTTTALPGDVILFYTGSISENQSTHVGIYAGNGTMIHCCGGPANYDAEHAGPGVQEGSVSGDGRPYEVRRVVSSDITSAQQLLEQLSDISGTIQYDHNHGKDWTYGEAISATVKDTRKSNRVISDSGLIILALREMGIISGSDSFRSGSEEIIYGGGSRARLSQYCDILTCRKSAKELENTDNLLPGDICFLDSACRVYAGNSKWYTAEKNGSNGHYNNGIYCYSTAGPVSESMNDQIHHIIRFRGTSGPSGEQLVNIVKEYNSKIKADIRKGNTWHTYSSFNNSSFQQAIDPDGKKRVNGVRLANWALYDAGILEYGQTVFLTTGGNLVMSKTIKNELEETCDIISPDKQAAALIRGGQLKQGDICFYGKDHLVCIYVGNGKCFTADKGYASGHINKISGSFILDSLGPVSMPGGGIKKIIRIKPPVMTSGTGTGGHKTDGSSYTQDQLELIWAIVAQEDNGSYEGALAVISTAMNRVDSPNWSYLGSSALAQLTAPGQFCYSIDTYWRQWLGGNVPEFVKKAVDDCLRKGIRNHPYTCFRSTPGSQTGANPVQIGTNGNWYFGN